MAPPCPLAGCRERLHGTALLKLLLSHAGLPRPEPMAEHSALSLISDPTRRQSRRIWSLTAAKTYPAMCAGVI